MHDPREYQVGYGKPPEETRFKKGQSGNPNGRKKKPRSIQEFGREMLDEKVEVRLNGRVNKVSRAQMIVMRIMQDLMGDNSSARSRALKDLERYVPNFHLPPPDDSPRVTTIEIIQPQYFGLPTDMTRKECLDAAEWILEQRKQQSAAKKGDRVIKPDPLDM